MSTRQSYQLKFSWDAATAEQVIGVVDFAVAEEQAQWLANRTRRRVYILQEVAYVNPEADSEQGRTEQ